MSSNLQSKLQVEVLKDPNHDVLTKLNFMRKSGHLCDVTIVLEGGGIKLRAHKCLLAACSSFFEKLFGDSHDQQVVAIDNFKADDITMFLDFVYTGKFLLLKNVFSKVKYLLYC